MGNFSNKVAKINSFSMDFDYPLIKINFRSMIKNFLLDILKINHRILFPIKKSDSKTFKKVSK